MPNTRESALYLAFFNRNFFLILSLLLVGGTGGIVYSSTQPALYVNERFYEFDFTHENAAAVEKESSEVVSVLRSAQLKEQLGIQKSSVVVFKPGPFSLIIQTKNTDPESSIFANDQLRQFLSSNYQVEEIGIGVAFNEKVSLIRYGLIGALIGLVVGFLVSLVLAYFRTY